MLALVTLVMRCAARQASTSGVDVAWPCAAPFPFPDTQPNAFVCYNTSTFATRKAGPCGSWCSDCKGFGAGCGSIPMCATAVGFRGCPPPPPPPPPPSPPPPPFTLFKLPEFVGSHGARCLDGSPPSFYVQSKGMLADSFLIDFEGGGW